MSRQLTKTMSIIAMLLLAGDLSMPLLVFPLSCLGVFCFAALLPGLVGGSRTVFDPVHNVWEFDTLSPKEFHFWAHRINNPKRYGPATQRFLKTHQLTLGMKFQLLFSKARAFTYVHAMPLVVSLLVALLGYDLYLIVGGHTVVWTNPRATGAATGAVWGFCFGLYLVWRKGMRIRVAAEPEASAAVK